MVHLKFQLSTMLNGLRKKRRCSRKILGRKFAAYAKAYPELAAEFTRRVNGELPTNWAAESKAFIEKLQANPASIASRKASQNAIEAYAHVLPEFLGWLCRLSKL